MRFLLGTAALLIAACSGSSSTELFGAEPARVSDPAPTEPTESPGAGEAPPSDPLEGTDDDAGAFDATVPEKDAGPDAAKDAGPPKCSFDSECKGDELCNWKTDVCAEPGPIGAPCKRDDECSKDLCNWKLEACSAPGKTGTPCRRNKECASGTCSSSICK